MSSARTSGSPLLAGALVTIGVLAVHEARYRLAYGEAAAETLAAHGHGYLAFVAPLVVIVLALSAGHLITRWAAGRACGRPAHRLRVLWPVLIVALIAVFSAQELIEGALGGGHPSGSAAVFAGGGWIAFAAAFPGGLVVALLIRASGDVEPRQLIAVHLPLSVPANTVRPVGTPSSGVRPSLSPLGARGPPLVL